jgi:hypothetical protein
MEYDDDLTCMQQGYVYRISKNKEARSKIFPNPATNDVTLIYNTSGKCKLKISDVSGRILMESTLPENNFNFIFNVGKMEDGLYNYHIIDSDNELVDTGQFVVIK